jgi:hypothetical protein
LLHESEIYLEDSANCKQRGAEMFHQYLGGNEGKLVQMSANAICKVRKRPP